MKIHQIISETPLPDTWDKDVFKRSNSYQARIEYAVARAQQLGQGSARTAFTIEYQGRQTILKIAHNAKGMSQNDTEANILSDEYAKSLGILIPIIDYDQKHKSPVWIHMEQAKKIDRKTLCDKLKTPRIYNIFDYAKYMSEGKTELMEKEFEKVRKHYDNDVNSLKTFLSYAKKFHELNTKYHVLFGDLEYADSWGLYKNKPVIIDIGLTHSVYGAHYF